MCDTFVVMHAATADGSVIFGKNSDREPNEAQEVILVPAQNYPAGEQLRCTYIEIPQVEHTHAMILSKPFWMWGAEMGVNERGVVIGNEAVFTRAPMAKEGGLTGMDLLRLALERSSSAGEALQTILDLLAQYGQGGNCGFAHPMYYHNSFIIADQKEAYVLETAGAEWAVERVHGMRSISNVITIHKEWDKASPGLVDQALERGWVRSKEDFDFSAAYSDLIYTNFGAGRSRHACTTSALEGLGRPVTVEDAFATLRLHGMLRKPGWRPDRAVTGADVCMHAGFGPVRVSQTTGSMVVHLMADGMTVWVTATAAPCLSIYKPVWFTSGLPWAGEPAPQGKYDEACVWWRHEAMHRAVLMSYPELAPQIQTERDASERGFLADAAQVESGLMTPAQVSSRTWEKALSLEKEWLTRSAAAGKTAARFYYRSAWKKFNQEAGM